MNEINDLRNKLLNNPDKDGRLKAAEELTEIASEGNDKAAEILYEMLEKENDPNIWIKPFEIQPKSKEDGRRRFVWEEEDYDNLSIMPILEKKRDIAEHQKTAIIKFAKSFIELYEANDWRVVPGAMTILSYLTDEDDLFNFVDMWLKKDTTNIHELLSSLKHRPDIFRRIILVLRDNPDEYSLKFVKIFNWFLTNPLPDTAEIIGKELWLNLPLRYKEAVRLYYYKEIEDLYQHFYELKDGEFKGAFPVPTKHPFLEWLEGFERGAVTSSIASYSALQMTAEKIGLHLKDAVKQIETDEPLLLPVGG